MRRKIVSFSALLAAISVVITALFIYWVVYNDYAKKTKQEIKNEAGYIQAAVEVSGDKYLEQLDKNSPGKNRITLIDKTGKVLYDNQNDVAAMENHLNRPEVVDALNNGEGQITRYSDTISKQTFYYAVVLKSGNVLRIANTTDSIVGALLQVGLMIAGIIVLVSMAAWAISNRITRKIVEPINSLNLEQPEENTIYEELAPLLLRMKQQNKVIDKQMAEIKKQQVEFTTLTDNMKEGFLVLGGDGTVLSYNKSVASLLNSGFDDLNGKNILEISRNEKINTLVGEVQKGKESETLFSVNKQHMQVIGSPILQENKVRGVVLLFMDVTERRDREKLRREFTANVSHELKTPLTTISGYAEIIKDNIAKPEDIPRFANNIYAETQRLINLVGDIISLSELDEGNTKAQLEDVDLFYVAKDTIDRLQPAALQKKVTLELKGQRAEVNGYGTIIEEMVFNLVENAIKYNREKGLVTVTVTEDKDSVFLQVKDTGIGIAKAEQERVFERFYRADKSRSKTEGTGLGLAIVKHGAGVHNAEVSLNSTPQKGTEVTVKFPKVK